MDAVPTPAGASSLWRVSMRGFRWGMRAHRSLLPALAVAGGLLAVALPGAAQAQFVFGDVWFGDSSRGDGGPWSNGWGMSAQEIRRKVAAEGYKFVSPPMRSGQV